MIANRTLALSTAFAIIARLSNADEISISFSEMPSSHTEAVARLHPMLHKVQLHG
jgi:hypothetical protein